MDAMYDPGVGYNRQYSIWSFRIGAVERVNILKSMESLYRLTTLTSLTGRPGMSIRTQQRSALTRVKLGKNVSSDESGYLKWLELENSVKLD